MEALVDLNCAEAHGCRDPKHGGDHTGEKAVSFDLEERIQYLSTSTRSPIQPKILSPISGKKQDFMVRGKPFLWVIRARRRPMME